MFELTVANAGWLVIAILIGNLFPSNPYLFFLFLIQHFCNILCRKLWRLLMANKIPKLIKLSL